MPTCQFPDCTEDTPSKRHKYCQPHREIVAKAILKKHNASNRAKKRNKPAEVYYCKTEGCGKEVPNIRTHYCPECRVEQVREWKRNAGRRAAEKAAEFDRPINEPWVPRPKTPPILTDAEQRNIDAEILAKERLRCGCTHSPVRLLPREEIEQLQHQYQPAKYIKNEVILPWSKRCAAEPKGTSLRRP